MLRLEYVLLLDNVAAEPVLVEVALLVQKALTLQLAVDVKLTVELAGDVADCRGPLGRRWRWCWPGGVGVGAVLL